MSRSRWPGQRLGAMTIYVQVPDTLAINGNSKVMVADVYVGSIKSIQLKNWVATLTLGVDKNVKLPKNAIAKIGQTSLLGSQHVELASPPNPSQELLKNGDTIPLKNSSAYPTTEQTLASLSLILRGGGIPNLEVLQNEVYNIFNGRGSDPVVPGQAGHLHQPAQSAARRHHPCDRLDQQAADLRGGAGRRARPGADRHPAAGQAFRRHQEPADQRRRRGRTAQPGGRPVPVGGARAAAHRPAGAAMSAQGAGPRLAVSDRRAEADPDAAVRHRHGAEDLPRRLHQHLADARRDLQLRGQRVPHRYRVVGGAARARAVVRA